MNSVYNSGSDICCANKEQCFTPTLLSWSSIQLSSKSFTSSMTETGKYAHKQIQIHNEKCVLFTKFRLRLLHSTKPHQIENRTNHKFLLFKPNSADCDRFEIVRFLLLFLLFLVRIFVLFVLS